MSIQESTLLSHSDILLLFTITTPNNVVFRMCSKYPVNFMGIQYEFLPHSLTGLQESTGEEKSRPQLEITNPRGVLTKIALSGDLEGADVSLIRISELEFKNNNVTETRVDRWRVYRIISISTQQVALELRGISDFPKGKFPYRGYYAPDFKTVTL
jgi:phage-related protein